MDSSLLILAESTGSGFAHLTMDNGDKDNGYHCLSELENGDEDLVIPCRGFLVRKSKSALVIKDGDYFVNVANKMIPVSERKKGIIRSCIPQRGDQLCLV